MFKIICFAAIALASAAVASDVIELDDSNFEDKVGQYELMLIEFYAPWCGHCKKLAPEYEKAATALLSNDPPVYLAKVDCPANSELCSKFGVSGYPTLKIFRNGALSEEYQGPRQSDGIISYMKRKSGPTSKSLSSVAGVEAFISGSDLAIIGFFESEGSELQKQFMKLADTMSEDGHKFGHSLAADVLTKYGKDTIKMFRPKHLQSKFEDAVVEYKGDDTLHKMKSWVVDNAFGLCGHRTMDNQNHFKKPLVIAYYDVDYVRNVKGTNYWRNRVMKVAKKFADAGKAVNFAVSDKDDFAGELQDFNMEFDSKPIVAARDAAERKYVMADEFSMDNLEKFVSDLLDGNLKAYIKSEPIPQNNDGPVKVVVGENFDEIVNDPTKDVLIEFYAPWCGHCKNLAPKYEELAEKLQAESDIVIAKVDATANDIPGPYEVRGYPTIYFAPKNQKNSPKKYEGGREVDDFINYLKKEATDGLKHITKKKGKKTEL